MYANYPQHDVPQNNLFQRFFAQRWSAIAAEILMTIVITVAAGSAFDIFDPFDERHDAAATTQAEAVLPSELLQPGFGISLREVERKTREYIADGRYAEAGAALDLLAFAKPAQVAPIWYLEIAQLYAKLGGSMQAALNYERYFELVGKNAHRMPQSG